MLFFSRQIGIADGQAVPILGGARVTGKLGDYNIGALAIRSGESTAAGSPETDFAVFRLKRDVLGRSTVGVMGTYRSHTPSGLGQNFAYGMDADFERMPYPWWVNSECRGRVVDRVRSMIEEAKRGRVWSNTDREVRALDDVFAFQPGVTAGTGEDNVEFRTAATLRVVKRATKVPPSLF